MSDPMVWLYGAGVLIVSFALGWRTQIGDDPKTLDCVLFVLFWPLFAVLLAGAVAEAALRNK